MIYRILSFVDKVFPAKAVYAHCDIPCGIYTVEPARTAAKTVVRMVELIEKLEPPNTNSLVRYIAVKEEHAQKCKEELLILWTDYFREEHLATFPDLHEKFWKAAKLCSKVKQEVNMEAAIALQGAVEEIADMFSRAEEMKKK